MSQNPFPSQRVGSGNKTTDYLIIILILVEDAVEALVSFAYTSNVSINEKNVQLLLKAAAILQLTEIVGTSCKFL